MMTVMMMRTMIEGPNKSLRMSTIKRVLPGVGRAKLVERVATLPLPMPLSLPLLVLVVVWDF